ncbi:MAG: M14-type cytosolic carboxypeptidase [Candidatus Hinthialibacter sp.]
MKIRRCWMVMVLCWIAAWAAGAGEKASAAPNHPQTIGLHYISTSFENASPLYWEIGADGIVHAYFVYDYERDSTNRANGHWHFQIQGEKGADITFMLHNFINVWNGKVGVPVSEKSICFLSKDGKEWDVIPTEFVDGEKVKFTVHMEQESMYAARLEPYRISDLEAFLKEICRHPLVEIKEIGHTAEGRMLEMIRAGDPDAPYRVFLRARSHPWEPGGNWVVQGLIRRLLKDDEAARRYRERFCVYVMPMANKDGVARGRTRFNSHGMDLNRKWDQPADPELCPENHALESWLEAMIEHGKRPHLAIDFHNDEGGRMHISRPNIQLETYLKRMKRLENLMREHTWFTEGATGGSFRNPGTIGEGFLERFGVDAIVQELNCNWIEGLKKEPMGEDWELLGEQYCEVFYRYFEDYE